MIIRQDVSGAFISPYVEKCIVYSIPIINSLSLSNIKSFYTLIVNYHARILSDISLYKLYASLMMHNFTNIQRDAYLLNVIDNLLDIRKTTKETLNIQDVQRISKIMHEKLSDLRVKIEDFYQIPRNSLTLFEDIPVEVTLNYNELKYKSPTVFNFYEGRVLYKEVLSLMTDFAVNKGIYEDHNLSSKFSFIDKFNNVLLYITKEINHKLNTDDFLEKLGDSCNIAQKVVSHYGIFTQTSIDLFLGREYSKIKEDIITALKNTL
jgi:hypothetical protein